MQAQALAAEGGHTRVNLHSLVDMHVVPLQDPPPAHHLQAGYNNLWVIPHFTVMSVVTPGLMFLILCLI